MVITTLVALLNGLAAVLAGVVIFGVNRIYQWGQRVEERLDHIEEAIKRNGTSHMGSHRDVGRDSGRDLYAQ